ncbi:hypothetical protein RRF57_000418 [Xylaria bambusicola]|uniref:Uncharacterized protein n=1 Tax=Xylaria bambusicola TaxID=326684 RepID=A0AAN7UC40_9PEZI
MRDKESQTSDVLNDMLQDSLRDSSAVIRACSAAQLVQYDEGPGRGRAQDARCLGDFYHKGALAAE